MSNEWPDIISDEDEFPEHLYSEEEITEMLAEVERARQACARSLRRLAAASAAAAAAFRQMSDNIVLSSEFIEEGQ